MKRIFVFTLAAAVAVVIAVPGAWAQDSATDEFTLEEIFVTAEKRSVNVQQIPASVVALDGESLVKQGKSTVAQMLEDVPNVKFAEAGRGGLGPNSNITIRGVLKTQDAGGGSPIPASTATYVDGVYDGIGGSYDIDRIEVLRGPQGTLYGRSAAGGVVIFHTKNPKLEEFSGNVLAEYGSDDRIIAQGAVNAPVGGKMALRAAFNYLSQDEGYWTGAGVKEKSTEGRIKALYQPSENFSAVLSLSAAEVENYDGGWTQYLPEPNTIVYEGSYSDPAKGSPTKYKQGSLEVNYDFGESALSYIGAIHSSDNRGPGALGFNRGSMMTNVIHGDPRETQTHEMRLSSDTEGPLTWLIGASYYKYTYKQDTEMLQVSVVTDPDPATLNAPIAVQKNGGSNTEYGIFTEETYEVQDNFRITAGLRFDKNKVEEYPGFDFNVNTKESNGASLNPPIWAYMPDYEDKTTFDKFTYKLRFEYDLTPENMIYATTATGYLPGMAQISPLQEGNTVDFIVLDYDQEKLTSYEAGSKNRFLDNRLQLNAAIFYLDFEGYQEAVNVTPNAPPPPQFMVVPVPVKMKGIEIDGTWLITPNDKLTFSGGWLDAQIDGYPDIPGTTTSPKEFMYLKRVPGLPEVTANLAYDHTFILANGSTLVPRAEASYTSSHYLSQVTVSQVTSGWLPYFKQDSYVLFNVAATWTSPQDKYSITAYSRNATDEEYKTQVQTPHDPNDPASVELGDPRTFGVMVGARF